MIVPPAEIIDRLSILKLKIERIGDSYLNNEFKKLKKSLEEFKQEGVRIKDEWVDKLYEINKKEWDLLEKINEERGKENSDYEKLGKLYLETERINKKRAETKNKIVEETGKGFKEIKKNHPSE